MKASLIQMHITQLPRTLMHVAQNIDTHCTEHWCTLHRSLLHIAQTIEYTCTEHLYNCTEHYLLNIMQNFTFYTHAKYTHTMNISWDISLTHSKVSLCCKVTYPSRELLIFQVFILRPDVLLMTDTGEGQMLGGDYIYFHIHCEHQSRTSCDLPPRPLLV